MTVLSTDNRVEYVGNGVLDTYPITFKIFKAGDLEVYVAGNLATDYVVSGELDEIVFNAGSIPAAAADILLIRVLDETQETSYPSNDKFPAKVHEDAIDRAVMLVQQLREELGRVPKLALTSLFRDLVLPDPASGQAMRWKATLDGLENYDPNGVPVGGSLALPVSVANGGTGATIPVNARINLELQAAKKGANIASAVNLALSGNGNYWEVTGTTGISTISAEIAGNVIYLRFQGALTLTHSASLILQGGVNAQTAAGDLYCFMAEPSAVWREIWRRPITNATKGHAYLGNGSWGVPPMRGHKWGLKLNNGPVGTDNNDIEVGVGEASSDDALGSNRINMALASALTKQLDAVWAAGTNAGGRIATESDADGTWYVFLFRRSGGADDVCFSQSLTPTLPDGGTNKRRVGAFIRTGSVNLKFLHDPATDTFWWKDPTLDVNVTNPATTVQIGTAAVPFGIAVDAIMNVVGVAGTAIFQAYVFPSTVLDEAPSTSAAPLANVAVHPVTSGTDASQIRVSVDATQNFNWRVTAGGAANVFRVATVGWVDTCGRFA